MDVYCKCCGEPWELLGITDDFTDEEKRHFWAGEGCPCCYGKPAPEKQPFPAELQEALEGILGDDHDGLAAEMESTMAEFTVRVIRDGDETKTQLIVNGIPVRESLPKPVSLTGNEDFQNIFTLVLNAFHKAP